MGKGLLQTVAAIMARAKRRLRAYPSPKRATIRGPGTKKNLISKDDSNEDYEEGDGVWQRTILMGEKCEPLEFSGVIFYDNEGRQVSSFPSTPRSPLRGGGSPFPSSFSFQSVIRSEDMAVAA